MIADVFDNDRRTHFSHSLTVNLSMADKKGERGKVSRGTLLRRK